MQPGQISMTMAKVWVLLKNVFHELLLPQRLKKGFMELKQGASLALKYYFCNKFYH